MRTVSIAALALTAATLLTAQPREYRRRTDNAQSPTAETSIMLKGRRVAILYNAPSVRNRQVNGGLVPYDRVWRMGADAATTLVTDTDLQIGNLRVPHGAYTLWIQASQRGWVLIVNRETGQWGTDYHQDRDFGRVPLRTARLAPPMETMRIALEPMGRNARLRVLWGDVQAEAPVRAR